MTPADIAPAVKAVAQTIPATSQADWFIAAWSFDPDTDQFIFRGKTSGAILGNTSNHEPTADYLKAFGGYHAFGVARYTTVATAGEFHGAAIYGSALDSAGIDDLIMRMASHMNADGIATV